MKEVQMEGFDFNGTLKNKDVRILACLRKNGRDTLTSLSKKTRVPISSLFDRLKVYKKSVIQKFTCLLDFGGLGFFSHAFGVFSVPKSKREEMRKFFSRHRNVNSVYRINHRYDFLVELVFRDIRELEDFLEVVEERFAVRPRHTFYVVESVCREVFLARDFFFGAFGGRQKREQKEREGQSRFFGCGGG